MDMIDKIREPLSGDFVRYEEFMRTTLKSENAFVGEIIDYILSSRGKGMRPMLVMLMAGIHSHTELQAESYSGAASQTMSNSEAESQAAGCSTALSGTENCSSAVHQAGAGLASKRLGKRTYLGAMLVEMVHMASLVHDDVVDEADTRHGVASVNSRWDARVSVLAGDYILAHAFAAGMESGQMDIVSYIISAVSSMAEGELIQINANRHRDITRELYFDIIYKKTASLLGVSCGVGAMSAGASAREAAIAREIGVNLGMAFQIRDDILDWAPAGQTGKPFCADLREKKITLPLLAILENSDPLERKLLMGRIDCVETEPEQIDHIRDLVIKEGGLAAAEEVMHGYIDRARAFIHKYPASTYRESLLMLCDYVGVRER